MTEKARKRRVIVRETWLQTLLLQLDDFHDECQTYNLIQMGRTHELQKASGQLFKNRLNCRHDHILLRFFFPVLQYDNNNLPCSYIQM